MSNKWKIIGLALSGLGALAGILGGIVADKQMEQNIEEAVERRLNPPAEEEES